jgi:hypothetical protein
MTDFVRLKSKHADLVPPHKTFECGPGWEQVLDKYFDAVGRPCRHAQSCVSTASTKNQEA